MMPCRSKTRLIVRSSVAGTAITLAIISASHAQTPVWNGIRNGADPSVATFPSSGAAAFDNSSPPYYAGSYTGGAYVPYRCDGAPYLPSTARQNPDARNPNLPDSVAEKQGYSGVLRIFLSSTLSNLFSSSTIVYVPIKTGTQMASNGTTPANACPSTTDPSKKDTAKYGDPTLYQGRVWAPFMFYDKWASNAAKNYSLYVYYADMDNAAYSAVRAVRVSLLNNGMIDPAQAADASRWNLTDVFWKGYDGALYHSPDPTPAANAATTVDKAGVDARYYYFFEAGYKPAAPYPGANPTNGTFVSQVSAADKTNIDATDDAGTSQPLLISYSADLADEPADATSPQHAIWANNYAAWEHRCNAQGGANEAPQPFNSPTGKSLFVSYSGNSFHSDFYAMGLLRFSNKNATTGDLADPNGYLTNAARWTKLHDTSNNRLPNAPDGNPWFGTTGVVDSDFNLDNNICLAQAAGGEYPTWKVVVPKDGDNYIVASGSNSVVAVTATINGSPATTLYNIYGGVFHSQYTNERTLHIQPIAIDPDGETPTWNAKPVREGVRVMIVGEAASTVPNGQLFTPGTYSWFQTPAKKAAYDTTVAQWPADAGLPSPSGLTGVSFSNNGADLAPDADNFDPADPDGNPQVKWAVASNSNVRETGLPTVAFSKAPYSFLHIRIMGTSVTLKGDPAILNGSASVYINGVLKTKALDLSAALADGTFYTVDNLPNSTYNSIVVMLNPQNDNDFDTIGPAGTGNQHPTTRRQISSSVKTPKITDGAALSLKSFSVGN